MKSNLTLLSTTLILTACVNHQTIEDNPTIAHHHSTLTMSRPVKLPNTERWQCLDGSWIQTQQHGQQLQLTYQQQTYTLTRTATTTPAIYQNPQLLFSSDGKTAILGRPYSNLIYASGCIPR